MVMFHALHVDVDGTHTDITLDGRELLTGLRKELGGEIEFAHYGRRLETGAVRGIAAIVRENSHFEDPRNPRATAAVAAVKAAVLPESYWLHGPVIFLGWDGGEHDTSLPDAVRAELLAAITEAGECRG